MSSATDELRRLLDERGVEWEDDGYPTTCTVWCSDGIVWHGLWRDDCIELIGHITPEQAIEATLGHAYEPPLAAHWDGDTLTLTIPRDPSCIRVQRSAEQPCKVYADESKVIAATLGRGECTDTGCYCFTCSECGWTANEPHHAFGGFWPNYCPNCGRKVRA